MHAWCLVDEIHKADRANETLTFSENCKQCDRHFPSRAVSIVHRTFDYRVTVYTPIAHACAREFQSINFVFSTCFFFFVRLMLYTGEFKLSRVGKFNQMPFAYSLVINIFNSSVFISKGKMAMPTRITTSLPVIIN